MRKIFALLVFFISIAFAAPAAYAEIPGLPDEQERKAGPLVVFSDDLIFSVKEPEGWTGDIENAPKLSAGVVLYRSSETIEKHTTLIAIRISRKVDENTAEDLAHDMQQYRSLYPDVEFLTLKTPHPSYRTYAKLFAIKNSSYQYVSYVNPGRESPYLFIVTMGSLKKKAAEADLKAFQQIVGTLDFLEAKPKHK
ncbi:MAG: hypothetical protein OEW15_17445 [Nitrospirota bacterium]|nr:hypothetical protein [Nitrospirota bacterium]